MTRHTVRAMLVTGAGSGIGLATVKALRARGDTVWAGARAAADLDTLAALGALPLALDVADAAQVAAAAARLHAEGVALHAIVHSAALGEMGPLAAWTEAELQRVLEVNVVGVHRVTRALLPALQRAGAGARVLVVSSMGGSITQPLYGPYTMSKFALEAWADCLRQELAPLGLWTTLIQPGAVATGMAGKARSGTEARLRATPPPFFEPWAAPALRALDAPPRAFDESAPESAGNRRAQPPEAVAAQIVALLDAERPPLRRLSGSRWEGTRVVDALLARLLDAAQSPGQGWTRDELVARLDAAWAQRGGDPG